MESKIDEIYVLYPTTKSIWDDVSRSYFDLEYSFQMFALCNRARNLHQEDASILTIFTPSPDFGKSWAYFRITIGMIPKILRFTGTPF